MTTLSTYVSTVLVEICQGVSQATTQINELGGSVNPQYVSPTVNKHTDTGRKIVEVAFDVVLEVATSSDSKGKAGVNVLAIRLGTERDSHSNERKVNSVSFVVPITLPVPPETITAENKARDASIRRLGQSMSGLGGSLA